MASALEWLRPDRGRGARVHRAVGGGPRPDRYLLQLWPLRLPERVVIVRATDLEGAHSLGAGPRRRACVRRRPRRQSTPSPARRTSPTRPITTASLRGAARAIELRSAPPTSTRGARAGRAIRATVEIRPKREPGRGGAAAVKAAPRDEFAVAVRS